MNVIHNLLSFPGWHTKRKIVVIESDDWGSIRMPAGAVHKSLLALGMFKKEPYSLYDTLENKEDFEQLFSVLEGFHSNTGKSPIVTLNTIVANPDFEKIKATGFKNYSYEPFTTTYLNRDGDDTCLDTWKQGMDKRYIRPQFHGREHVNVKQWLSVLRQGETDALMAFEHHTFAIPDRLSLSLRGNYMATYDLNEADHEVYLQQSITEGVEIFEHTFGFKPLSQIAPCYLWGSDVEKYLDESGFRFIQGIYYQFKHQTNGKSYKKKFHYTGQRNSFNQIYVVRNAFFEPSLNGHADHLIDECLTRIKIAFRWGKPAIIGSHRLNFMGGLSSDNRAKTLTQFRALLDNIVKEWPDVEFMSTDQLGILISNAGE
jgi:hypothetical protein